MDIVRVKAKRVFAGAYAGTDVRFSITATTEDGADHALPHVPLGGCSPVVQEALAARAPVPMGALEGLTNFCRELTGRLTSTE